MWSNHATINTQYEIPDLHSSSSIPYPFCNFFLIPKLSSSHYRLVGRLILAYTLLYSLVSAPFFVILDSRPLLHLSPISVFDPPLFFGLIVSTVEVFGGKTPVFSVFCSWFQGRKGCAISRPLFFFSYQPYILESLDPLQWGSVLLTHIRVSVALPV